MKNYISPITQQTELTIRQMVCASRTAPANSVMISNEVLPTNSIGD